VVEEQKRITFMQLATVNPIQVITKTPVKSAAFNNAFR